MKGLRYLIVITKRRFSQAYLDFFDENGVDCVFVQQCIGSANDKILEYMSLEHSEKIMFSAFVPTDELPALKKGMLSDLHLNENGNGIALTVPVDGIGGRTALGYFIGDKELSEEQDMEENKFCLIVTIVNQGFADVVMDAAREVNARGGTILKAKGTAPATLRNSSAYPSPRKKKWCTSSQERRPRRHHARDYGQSGR